MDTLLSHKSTGENSFMVVKQHNWFCMWCIWFLFLLLISIQYLKNHEISTSVVVPIYKVCDFRPTVGLRWSKQGDLGKMEIKLWSGLLVSRNNKPDLAQCIYPKHCMKNCVCLANACQNEKLLYWNLHQYCFLQKLTEQEL